MSVKVRIKDKEYFYDVDGGMNGVTEIYEVDKNDHEKEVSDDEFDKIVESTGDKWALDEAIDKYTEKNTEWQ